MTVFWSLVAALGAVVFLIGVNSGDAQQVWSIYLVNLVFWSGLAVTGPAIAGMMQVTEARWSPSVRRIALTTAGFLPISFILLLVLYTGQTVLYPWVTKPIPAKAGWLNVPFFWLRTYVCAAVLFAVCFAFVRALLRDAIPPEDERERAHRNRVAVVLLMLWLVTVSLWGFDLVMSLDPKWYSGLFGGYFVVSTLYTAFCLLSIFSIRAALPRPTCCCKGDAPNDPPLDTVRQMVRRSPPSFTTVTAMRAPTAPRLEVTPTKCRVIQSLPCLPGFSNRRLG